MTNKPTTWRCLVFVILVSFSGLTGCAYQKITPDTGEPSFHGRALLGVSDADMRATGELRRDTGTVDSMTVIPLPLDWVKPGKTTTPAPNSVISWPQVVEVSPDGRYAYVVETRGTPSPEVEGYDDVYRDFPSGNRLSVFSIKDPTSPRHIETVSVPQNPNTVQKDRSGRLLVMASDDNSREVVFVPLKNGRPQAVVERDVVAVSDSTKHGGVRSVAMHPSGKYFAANIRNQKIVFFRIYYGRKDQPLVLRQHGDPVNAGNHIGELQFTSDGDFLIASDLKGRITEYDRFSYLYDQPGRLISIKFDKHGAHRITDTEKVGHLPRGFDISPEKNLIVTVNINRSYLPGFLPTSFRSRKSHSSLTVVEFDNAMGIFYPRETYPFKGILPGDVVFDRKGENIAVAVYQEEQGKNESSDNGLIEFWSVDRSGAVTKLRRSDFPVKTIHGMHDLVVVP